jgi:4-amino-4-deoxy-L-arabinose transferase-like glycosyltransferase
MSWIRARPLLVLAAVAAFVCFVGISNELWTPDEPRVAEIGREMWRSRSWVMPRLNGEPFLERPPLYWWVQSAMFASAGSATPGLARLPSALFGFATVLLTFALARRYFGRETALLSGLVLLTTGEFAVSTHWVSAENALLLGATGTLACFAHAEGRTGWRRALTLGGMYAFLAASFLSSGSIGLAIPVLGLSIFLLWTGRLRRFLGWHLMLGGAAVAGVAGVWLWALWQEGGDEALGTFLVPDPLGRFLPGAVDHAQRHNRSPWYYLANAPALWLPWTPFLVLAVVAFRRNWDRIEPQTRAGVQLCLATSAPLVLALSLAGTKRAVYLDPVLPSLAILVGAWMVAELERARWEGRAERGWQLVVAVLAGLSVGTVFLDVTRWPWSATGALLVLVFAATLRVSPPRTRPDRHLAMLLLASLAAAHLFLTVKPFVDRYKSFVPFVDALQRWVPGERTLHAFAPDETILGVVGFYAGRRMQVVDLDGLRRMARAPDTHWVLVRDRRPEGGFYGSIGSADIPHRLVSEHRVGNRRTLRILALGAMNTASERGPSQPPGGAGQGD